MKLDTIKKLLEIVLILAMIGALTYNGVTNVKKNAVLDSITENSANWYHMEVTDR